MANLAKAVRSGGSRWLRTLVVAALALLGAAPSCGGLDECPPGQPCEVRGFVVVGPEVWAFQHCGSATLISVDVKGSEPGFDKLDQALREDQGCSEGALGVVTCLRETGTAYTAMTGTAYTAMTASISAPGHYGHLGKYERELEMLQIHAASAIGPANCPKLDPVVP